MTTPDLPPTEVTNTMSTATDNAARRVLDAWADLTVNDFIQLASDNGMEVEGCAVWLRPSDNMIVAFRQLEDGPEEWTEIPAPATTRPTTLDELVYNVEVDRAEIDEIEAGERDVTEWLEAEVLEIVTVLRRSWDTSDRVPVVDRWELLTAVFGPTVRIDVQPSGQVIVRGYWGGDEVERYTVSHVLADTLASMDPDA